MDEKTRRVVHSSARHDWGTPRDMFESLNNQYNFSFDFCATEENALLDRYCADAEEGVISEKGSKIVKKIDWEDEIFFCNPPYGRSLRWILDIVPTHSRGVFLLPSRTGAKWWINLINKSSWCFFLRGRITFSGGASPAPFDSILVGRGLPEPTGFEGVCFRIGGGGQ